MSAHRVVIQGEEGSNSHVAAQQLFGPEVALTCCSSFAEALTALTEPKAVGVLPFENSTAGLVPEVAAALINGPGFVITAETFVTIRFVAAARGALDTITKVLAHPMAAKQCQRFLTRVGWSVLPAHDTAGAARLVSEGTDTTIAALCPAGAATKYALNIIEPHCGDDPSARTRFFAVLHAERAAVRPEHNRALFMCAAMTKAHVKGKRTVLGDWQLVEAAVNAADLEIDSHCRLIGSFTS